MMENACSIKLPASAKEKIQIIDPQHTAFQKAVFQPQSPVNSEGHSIRESSKDISH
jgi:hypothetical protein